MIWVSIVAISVAAGIGGGIGIGYAIRGGSVDDLKTANRLQQDQLQEATVELQQRQSRVDQLTGEQQSLEDRLGDLRQQADELQDELDAKAADIDTLRQQVRLLEDRPATTDLERLDLLRDQLEADRLLLVEMRKEDPDTREEAQRIWANIKRFAVRSDPSLVPKADKVTRALPAYYDWLDQDFVSAQEAQLSFRLTRADLYTDSVDEFWKSFLIVVIDRIDAVAKIAE